jgi:hypothetical protein
MKATRLGVVAAGVALCGVLASAQSHACGYDDPASLSIGALNFAYPDSLHVNTAVWQAQVAGVLPRHDRADFTRTVAGADLAQRQQAALWEVMRLAEQVRAHLASRGADDATRIAPPAIVFADSGLWIRFVWQFGRLNTLAHQMGPADNEAVLVTLPVALRAVLDARLSFEAALESGIIRTYGPDTAQAQLRRQWPSSDKTASLE